MPDSDSMRAAGVGNRKYVERGQSKCFREMITKMMLFTIMLFMNKKQKLLV